MDIFKIIRDGEYLICEEHQLESFFGQGWEVAPPEETVFPTEDSSYHKTDLVALTKDGDTRLYEINQVPAAREQGWVEGGQHGEHELEGDDSRSRAPEGHSGGAQGGGTDLGEQGSGSGSDPDAGSDDESPEGSEDLEAKVLAALDKLDHKNDEHWTAYGNPNIYALRKIVDFDIKKAQVEKYAPDFKRIKE